MAQLLDEQTQYIDQSTGELIVNGSIYIGAQNLDPKLNLITIYSDRDLLVPIANPQLTGADGRAINKIWIPEEYSLAVYNSNDVQKYISLDSGAEDGYTNAEIDAEIAANKTTKYYDTIALAVADIAKISIGDVIYPKDRGGTWDAVDATTVTENERDIVTGNATVSLQLRDEYVNLKHLGGTGLVDETSIIQDFLSSSNKIGIDGTYTCTIASFDSEGEVSGVDLVSTETGGFTAFTLSSANLSIDNASLTGSNTTQTIDAGVDLDSFRLSNSVVEGAGSFQINRDSTKIRLLNNDIDVTDYGFLLNDGGAASSKVFIIGNSLISSVADAIEINNPTITTDQMSEIVILGNVCEVTGIPSSENAGFCIGIAGSKNNVVIANAGVQSKNEAMHVEDGQYNTVLIGNAMDSCEEEGAWFSVSGAGGETGEPVIIAGNQLKAAAANTTAGIFAVYDVSGTLSFSPIIGNRVKDFDAGLSLGNGTFVAVGNTIQDGTVGLDVFSGSYQAGVNASEGVTSLVQSNGGTITDKIIAKTKPTNIINRVSGNPQGATLKGFSFTFPANHTGGSSTQEFDIGVAPDRMLGQVIVTGDNGISSIFSTHTTQYDGTTLTNGTIIKNNVGAVDAAEMKITGGRLVLSFYSVSAVNFTSCRIDFDGAYYIA